MISVRLVTLDYYMSKDYNVYNKSKAASKLSYSCPVLRVFGPTSTGVKACVHIHGVYPYLYVPYEGGENPERDSILLAAGLDRALQTAAGERAFNQRFVHRVTLVSGIPIYGYHSRPRQFLKIYLLNPYSVRKAADLLLSGAIMNMKLQPHESHIPFTQQFMIDYNLFGMSYINFNNVKYRVDPNDPDSLAGIESDLILPSSVKKISHSCLEIDVMAEDILNRLEDRSASANPGLAGIWAEERARRRLKGRLSEPSPVSTQMRPENKPFGVEADFLKDLMTRLSNYCPKEEPLEISPITEPRTPYPAEFQDETNILDASAFLDVSQVVEENVVPDITEEEDGALFNVTLVHELSQRLAAHEDREEHVDLDAEMGRAEEAESEEEEDGPDLTQPLNPPSPQAAVLESSGDSSSESEEEFWRDMADQLFQLDGAGDSSDLSDDQRHSQINRQWKNITQLDAADSLSNIISFLGENECLQGFSPSQSPPFWDHNPSWEQWSWDSPTASLNSFHSSVLSTPAEMLTPVSEIDRCSDTFIESDLNHLQTIPSPSSTSDVQGNSTFPPTNQDSSVNETYINSIPNNVNSEECSQIFDKLKKMIESRKHGSTDSLTLKEYLKNLGEIIKFDFKVINGTDMVIIEYVPPDCDKEHNVSRYFIKPIVKFIEEWDLAEADMKNKKLGLVNVPKYIDGFISRKRMRGRSTSAKKKITKPKSSIKVNNKCIKKLEHHYSEDWIRRKKIVPKFVVRSVEVINELENEDVNITEHNKRGYSVNESFISKDKITLKLVKSNNNNKFNEKNILINNKNPNNVDEIFFSDKQLFNHTIQSNNEITGSHLSSTSPILIKNKNQITNQTVDKHVLSTIAEGNVHSDDIVCDSDIKKEPVANNEDIIIDVNSKFEEYYKNVIKKNKVSNSDPCKVKSEYEVIDICDSSSDEDDECDENNRFQADKKADVKEDNLDPVKFVSQLLTTYSSLPQSSSLPPLSITVNIGNLPVHVSVQPALSHHVSLDGANDDSSDDSTKFRSDSSRKSKKKKAKYKPLQVVMQKSPESKKRKSADHTVSTVNTSHRGRDKRIFESLDPSSTALSICSRNEDEKRSIRKEVGSSRKSKQTEESKSLSETSEQSVLDIPGPSTSLSGSRKSQLTKKCYTEDILGSETSKRKRVLRYIPQTDVIATSSDEEYKHSNLKRKRRRKKTLECKKTEMALSIDLVADSVCDKVPRIMQVEVQEESLIANENELKEISTPSVTALSVCAKGTLDSSVQKEYAKKDKDGCKSDESHIVVDNVTNCEVDLINSVNNELILEDKSIVKSHAEVSVNVGEAEIVLHNSNNITVSPVLVSSDSSEPIFRDVSIFENYADESISKDNSKKIVDQSKNEIHSNTARESKEKVVLSKSLEYNISMVENSSKLEDDISNLSLFPSTAVSNDNTSLFVFKSDNVGSRTFTPGIKPPGACEVLSSMYMYNLEPTTGIKPFYSDYRDISKHLEIGNKVLKVENHSVAGLKSFNNSLECPGLEELREMIVGENFSISRSALIEDKPVTITPLLKPPSAWDIENWLKRKIEKQIPVVKPKLKVLAPLGDNGSDSDDASLTLTPCTPQLLEVTPENTPHSSKIHLSQPEAPKETTPILPLTQKAKRRVSFDDLNISQTSNSPSTPKERSTPFNKGLSSPSLTRTECKLLLKKGPLSKGKGRKRLIMTKERRESVDSNRSIDMFSEKEEEIEKDLEEKPSEISSGSTDGISKTNNSCMLQGITLDNTFGFKTSLQNFQEAKPQHDLITVLIVEVLTETRGSFRPDPHLDAILAVFYAISNDIPPEKGPSSEYGVLTVGKSLTGTAVDLKCTVFEDEVSLLKQFATLVRSWDPDIFTGYETEQTSWGFILERGYTLGLNLVSQLGRIIVDDQEPQNLETGDDEDVVPKFIRHLQISGRIILNLWRLIRKEIALTSYTFENVMFHLVHERHALLPFRLLSHLWEHHTARSRYIAVEYFIIRLKGIEKILAQLDLIARTSELARLFGIQFTEVLTRGSQFRVESMMLRLAKPKNYVPVSPSMEQRALMRAPAHIPMIMEPESQFYSDPVIVLDFQSLYPSMIIAYNYCFSTCLGRATCLGQSDDPFEFGCTRLSIPTSELSSLCKEDLHISPAGVAFVKSSVRKGVLPAMLEEILETRLMVKRAMKEVAGDKVLHKMLHARQLGLKLIANVTYGYTAANFSGRMPCIEVGDSVVSKGRETLQRAIRLVESTPHWRAKVIYGDTDSLFVMTPGRTREEAFRIGAEIANAVTLDNPQPVKLKLEKVYQPCILQTKKRYVGYMYESPSQKEAVYEAKGIETVRRDGCPAVAKVLQKALQILFETSDISLVKKYTLKQFAKIFQGRVNIQDMIFAKEYRGRKGYRPGSCVPALQLAKQWTRTDKRAEPRKKERVPYVIVHGAPGVPLIRLVRSPWDLLKDPSLRIHAAYYITKAIIPAMQRCFTLLGADPLAWYATMPRRFHRMVRSGLVQEKRKQTISQYFADVECVVCGTVCSTRICPECGRNPQKIAAVLYDKARRWERSYAAALEVCKNCCGRLDFIDCISLDCPVLFRRKQLAEDEKQSSAVREILESALQF